MTANEVICNGDRLALRFSQHGSSRRHDNRTAAWAGVGLYFWNESRLTANWALEDYYARRRQLAEGVANNLEPPAVAPWDVPIVAASEAAEEAATAWLMQGSIYGTDGVVFDDEWDGHDCGPVIDVGETVVDDLFSAGPQVAFHMTQRGTYLGGAGKSERIGEPAKLCSAGIVTVSDTEVVGGRVVRDRSGIFA